MTGKVYDRKTLVVDRDPTHQLAVEVGKFPKASPTQLVTAFANALEEYGLEAIEGVTGLDLSGLKTALDNLKALLGGVDLFHGGNFDPAAAVAQFFQSVPAGVLALLGGANWGDLLSKLTGGAIPGGGDPLTSLANFFKQELGAPILAGRLPLIPLAHIRDVQPNLLNDPSFDHEETLLGFPDWDWDDTDGRTKPGCAYTMADGQTHTLHSNTVQVGPDDVLDVEVWAKWTGLAVSAAGAVTLAIAAYRANNTLIGGGPAVVASAGGAGTSGWVKLSRADWPVPDDATYVVLELTLTTKATAGALRLDDASLSKNGALPQSYVSGLTSALEDAAARVQGVVNQIWTGITRQALDGPKNLLDLFEVLGNIPATSVGGVGGMANIGQSLTETWTQLWGGFAQAIGGGKSIADAANAAGNVAGTADTAQQISVWNNAILELRNNKSLMEGMDETSESNFLLSDLLNGAGDPPLILATASASPFSFWRARETAQKGFISWYGKGVANVTALYLDIYRFNYAAQTLDLLHTSPNQIGQFPADNSWKLGLYYLPAANRFQVNAGDVIGIAWRVVGTGTHSIAGKLGDWLPADTTVHPQKPAATLPANGPFPGAPLAALNGYYAGSTAWFGIGIAAGDVPPPYNAPRTAELSTPGAYAVDVEAWMNVLECVYLGAGGGGCGGNPITTIAGEGGFAGQWVTETLVRGVDFPQNFAGQITGTVGNGGAYGPYNSPGGAGGATTRNAIPGGKGALSAAGGAGGAVQDNAKSAGKSPGNKVYGSPAINYVGGGAASGGRPGADGSAAGGGAGGGYGGTYGVAFVGGTGARGGAWFRAKQS